MFSLDLLKNPSVQAAGTLLHSGQNWALNAGGFSLVLIQKVNFYISPLQGQYRPISIKKNVSQI